MDVPQRDPMWINRSERPIRRPNIQIVEDVPEERGLDVEEGRFEDCDECLQCIGLPENPNVDNLDVSEAEIAESGKRSKGKRCKRCTGCSHVLEERPAFSTFNGIRLPTGGPQCGFFICDGKEGLFALPVSITDKSYDCYVQLSAVVKGRLLLNYIFIVVSFPKMSKVDSKKCIEWLCSQYCRMTTCGRTTKLLK